MERTFKQGFPREAFKISCHASRMIGYLDEIIRGGMLDQNNKRKIGELSRRMAELLPTLIIDVDRRKGTTNQYAEDRVKKFREAVAVIHKRAASMPSGELYGTAMMPLWEAAWGIYVFINSGMKGELNHDR